MKTTAIPHWSINDITGIICRDGAATGAKVKRFDGTSAAPARDLVAQANLVPHLVATIKGISADCAKLLMDKSDVDGYTLAEAIRTACETEIKRVKST